MSNTDPISGSFLTARGRYELCGQTLTLFPYDRIGEPAGEQCALDLNGDSLSVTTLEFPQVRVYQLKTGCRADVLAREKFDPALFGTWWHEVSLPKRRVSTHSGRRALRSPQEIRRVPGTFSPGLRGQRSLHRDRRGRARGMTLEDGRRNCSGGRMLNSCRNGQRNERRSRVSQPRTPIQAS